MKRVVLVTGASRGIGKATVIEFAKKGYDVVINYLSSEKEALTLKKEVESQYSVKALTIRADISVEEQVQNMVEEVISNFGHIDVVVNNAGIAIDTTFEDKTISNFRRILDVNLIGTFLVSKYVGKYMLEKRSGAIINISSNNAIDQNYPEGLDYDASKAGIISLTKNLAVQYAPYIRVNSIAPGWVITDMTDDLDSVFRKKEESKVILNRFAEPSEIAKVVVFLASDDASYINGEVIRVDGGCNSI